MHGGTEIEGDEAEQFLVVHFREEGIGAALAAEQGLGDGALLLDHGVDAFFERAAAD